MQVSGKKPLKQTTIDDWSRSDAYHNAFLHSQDEVLDVIVKHNKDQGLPDIAVSAAQGKFLNLLAKSSQAKRILEIGTLGGKVPSCTCPAVFVRKLTLE